MHSSSATSVACLQVASSEADRGAVFGMVHSGGFGLFASDIGGCDSNWSRVRGTGNCGLVCCVRQDKCPGDRG